MTPGFSAITTSKFYHPAFNSAIFDGPIRIYFVQFHETYALKIYFMLQERYQESLNRYKDIAKQTERTLLIMIYPTEDSFQKAFSGKPLHKGNFAMAQDGRECVFGLLAPVVEDNVGQLMDELSDIFMLWETTCVAPVINSVSPRLGVVPEIF